MENFSSFGFFFERWLIRWQKPNVLKCVAGGLWVTATAMFSANLKNEIMKYELKKIEHPNFQVDEDLALNIANVTQ
ncbi:MAG: hypothetical protein PHW92_13990, partial [Lutibacter sp.]|nr:hypothetical protein [Lutibacter sp.]